MNSVALYPAALRCIFLSVSFYKGIWRASVWCAAMAASALHAQTAPTLIGQPQSVASWDGATISFSVFSQGTAPLQYEWQRRVEGEWQVVVASPPYALASGGRILVVGPVASSMHQDEFRCVVSNAVGSVVSATAVLTVGARPPSFVSQLGWVYAAAGSNVSITATLLGDEPMTMQWYRHNAPIAGATTATLTFSNVQSSDDGSYTLEATNAGGTRSSTAELRVVFPPTVSISAGTQTVRVGGQLDINGSTSAFYGVSY